MPLVAPADARTLTVGEGQAYALPSQAAAAAQEGDVVEIGPGTFFDCAFWNAPRVTIHGAGPETVITDATCGGKAIFVLAGDGLTIRDLTLARARVPDGNGAGIRLEGQSLTLERVHFINNQVGLLAGAPGAGEIHIRDCLFESGGVGGDTPLFAVMAGGTALLQVERSTFRDIKGGGISSSAVRTELTGNSIAVGAGDRPTVAVLIDAGDLLMQANVLTLGPTSPTRNAAVWARDSGSLRLTGNTLQNASGEPAALLLDWSRGPVVLDGNVLGPADTPRATTGKWRAHAAVLAHKGVDLARFAAGTARHVAVQVIRRTEAVVGR